jgi:hypothetical protein
MTRILALTVAMVASLSFVTTAQAQWMPYDAVGGANAYYGVSAYGSQPYGSFGLNYSQSSGMTMDQYGRWDANSYVQPARPVVQPARPVVAPQPQPRTRTSRTASRRNIVAQPRYQLPTGSLGWSDGNSGILYSPDMRNQSYGSGYGSGAYGVVDYSGMWHGMSTY